MSLKVKSAFNLFSCLIIRLISVQSMSNSSCKQMCCVVDLQGDGTHLHRQTGKHSDNNANTKKCRFSLFFSAIHQYRSSPRLAPLAQHHRPLLPHMVNINFPYTHMHTVFDLTLVMIFKKNFVFHTLFLP